jgi:leucyl-tRNA synthetase
VVSPDDVINELGADTLRTYEMFMAPFDVERPWDPVGIKGCRRFLEKVWRLQEKVQKSDPSGMELRIIHKATKKVTEDIEACGFNTCVSTLMEAVNGLHEQLVVSQHVYQMLLTLLSPFAPHMTEELWEASGATGFCSVAPWPTYDAQYLTAETWECPVQINGKVRVKLQLESGLDEATIKQRVEADPKVQEYLQNMTILKYVIVPGRLVSIVTQPG